ncbi:MAG: glycoside hydrolase family 127 protein, partial [Armatimonadetes bacterium]
MKPLALASIQVEDPFWAPRQQALVETTIPLLFERLEEAGNLENFRLAAARKTKGYRGPIYMDSDLYKAVEAAALTLQWHPEAPWRAALEDTIALIEQAQWEDGYINTWYSVHREQERYSNLRDAHELYCMGHLIEAALAHAAVDAESRLMAVARRTVAHLVDRFLIENRPGYPGHPEIELALLAYAEATGDDAALDLARTFLERRGSHFFAREHGTADEEYDGTYWLDRVPIRQLENLEGHAVRAMYLMSAVTDLARLTNDATWAECAIRLWDRVIATRQYITGGFGSTARNEGFTQD